MRDNTTFRTDEDVEGIGSDEYEDDVENPVRSQPDHFTSRAPAEGVSWQQRAADAIELGVTNAAETEEDVRNSAEAMRTLISRGEAREESLLTEVRAALRMEIADPALQRNREGATSAAERTPEVSQSFEERVESVKTVLRKLYYGDPELCERYLVPEYWRRLAAGTGLTVSEGDPLRRPDLFSGANVPSASVRAAAESLDERGYFVLEDVQWDPPPAFGALVEGVGRIKAAGWPAAFLLLYDQPWQVAEALFEVIGPLLGSGADDVELESDIAIWALEKRVSDGRYVDGNFSTPHRDSNYKDSVCADGSPIKLSVWLPLVDSTLDNGCMYVLPKNCDALFDKPSDRLHMAAAKRNDEGDLICRFPIHHVRPLPAPAGSVLSWMGNLIHWGSSCSPHKSVEQPRISMALTLRKREYHHDEKVASVTGRAPMARHLLRDMKLKNRLSVVGKSLIMYHHWTNAYTGLDLNKLKRGVLV
mmetsp:Transcript_32484/g.97256  ORF Transcript_32484/g.97256 Transcript_32484/m.97256 type:complete len:476 (-) Transcript_32484:51-1478(-)